MLLQLSATSFPSRLSDIEIDCFLNYVGCRKRYRASSLYSFWQAKWCYALVRQRTAFAIDVLIPS